MRGRVIPPKMWQIMLPRPGDGDAHLDPQNLEDTPGWLREADDFINTHFSSDEYTRIRDAWTALKSPGVKSDLLCYLILYIEGGAYTDIDTEALKPIDEWLNGGAWAEIPHRLQFCQWTIAAAPGHPLFMRMAYHTLDMLDSLAEQHQTALERLELTSFEVMTSSGPSSWTDVTFRGMKSTGPRLTGDILILTIDGFGMGQSHSDSTHDGLIPDAALLKHKFRGSWRHGG
ncbi:alpha-1,6-mannosyltransferase Och1 [Xylariaceae sp. FL0255]|nr:alpha-1,6-mannosyltransferase Och1 [Xylariaceae sp. FL0255]